LQAQQQPGFPSTDGTPAGGKPAILEGGAPLVNDGCLALPQILLRAAGGSPAAGIRYIRADQSRRFQSYAQLLEESLAIAGGLLESGVAPGSPVILQLALAEKLLPAFFGCLLAGLKPLPLGEPPVYELGQNNVQRLLQVAQTLAPAPVVAQAALVESIRGIFRQAGAPPATILALETLQRPAGGVLAKIAIPHLHETAFLMLTSGSTARPKLVAISHCLALTNLLGMVELNGYHSGDIALNWLLLHHVGALMRFLRDVYLNIPTIQVEAALILQNPLAWLDLIDEQRASLSWAANFAFARVVEKLERTALPEANPPGRRPWDLSCLRSLYSSGEMVSGRTMLRFAELLEPHGLRPDALHISWGMTETASTAVSSRRYVLELRANPAGRVRAGQPAPGIDVRVVEQDEAGQERVARQGIAGSLQVRGQLCTPAYVGDEALNKSAFTADGWLRTGDQGLIEDGSLVVLGRSSETVIVNGVNFAASEIESLLETQPGILPGCIAACLVAHKEHTEPALAVFYSPQDPTGPELPARLRASVTRYLGIAPTYLVALPPGEFPRTEIGKLQRGRLRDAFNLGQFDRQIVPAQQADYQAAPPEGGPLGYPGSSTERRVARIVAEVMEAPGVRPDENFFGLGIPSILVAELVLRLQAAFPGAALSAVEVFRYPTARSLAEYIRQHAAEDSLALEHVDAGLERAALRRAARRQRTGPDEK
jgi:polyketide synthase PksJ